MWLYFRFPLGLRMVEELLAARGIIVSHETVRQWARKLASDSPIRSVAAYRGRVTNGISMRPLWVPLPRPQHLLLAKPLRCNFLGESASIQVGIRRLG